MSEQPLSEEPLSDQRGSTRLGTDPPGPDGPARTRTGGGADGVWLDMQASDDFQRLRRLLRGFAFPATVVFLAWYLLYVLMSAYARGFLDNKLLGNINVAYVFGLLQFLSTFLIAYLYSRFAGRRLDPLADQVARTARDRGAV